MAQFLISVRIVLKSVNLSFNLFKRRKQTIRICPKSFNLFLSQCYSPLKNITHQKVFVMECPKNCAEIGHAIFGDVLRYVKVDLVEDVHFRISLRETLKIPRHDAINRQKNLPVTTFLEPAVKMVIFYKNEPDNKMLKSKNVPLSILTLLQFLQIFPLALLLIFTHSIFWFKMIFQIEEINTLVNCTIYKIPIYMWLTTHQI